MTGETIRAFTGRYRFLSNFYRERDGLTAEHRFQAAKATTQADHEWVMSALAPGEAKRRGRQITLRADWGQIKDEVMLTVLRVKFTDPELAKLLLDTGYAPLEEGNTWGDDYWGVDLRTGLGRNQLGQTLMQVREELRRAEAVSRW